MTDSRYDDWEHLSAPYLTGFALTLTRNSKPDAVANAYGIAIASMSILSRDELTPLEIGLDAFQAILRIGTVGPWTFGMEYYGHAGALALTLSELSRDTVALSISRSPNALTSFQRWELGTAVEMFEPMNPQTVRSAGELGYWNAALAHADRAAIGTVQPVLAAISDTTGLIVPDTALSAPLPTGVIEFSSSSTTPQPAIQLPFAPPT